MGFVGKAQIFVGKAHFFVGKVILQFLGRKKGTEFQKWPCPRRFGLCPSLSPKTHKWPCPRSWPEFSWPKPENSRARTFLRFGVPFFDPNIAEWHCPRIFGPCQRIFGPCPRTFGPCPRILLGFMVHMVERFSV